MRVARLRQRRPPGGEEESLEPLGSDVLDAEVDGAVNVVRLLPVAQRRDLIVLVVLQVEVGLYFLHVGREFFAVIPVALKDRPRHALIKHVGVFPEIIRPDPRPRAFFLDLLDEKIQVPPPQPVLPQHHVLEPALVFLLLLVHAQVKQARLVE